MAGKILRYEIWLSQKNGSYIKLPDTRSEDSPYYRHEGTLYRRWFIVKHLFENVHIEMFNECPDDQEFIDAVEEFERRLQK